MQLDPKLEIASRVLSGIIAQDRNRQLIERVDDIRHSLEVAAELIRQRDGGETPTYEHKPPLHAAPKTLERKVEREEVPLPELLQARRDAEATKPRKGSTLH
jgi:hypothetical protein